MPTELCFLVTEMLEENFANIVDTEFTAKMEEKLDTVEEGDRDWVDVLKDFYPDFHKQVEEAAEKVEKHEFPEEKIGEKCPKCEEGDLVKKHGRYGEFIACNRYPDCDFTRNVKERAEGKCPLCGSGLLIKRRRKRPSSIFYVCDKEGKDPKCEFISWDLPIEKNCTSAVPHGEKRYRGRFTSAARTDCLTNKRCKGRKGKGKGSTKKSGSKKRRRRPDDQKD